MKCKICETLRFGEDVERISDDFISFTCDGDTCFTTLKHMHTFSSCGTIDKFKADYTVFKAGKHELLEMDLIDGHIIIRECIRSV